MKSSGHTSKPNGSKKGQIRQERCALLKGLIFTSDGRAITPYSTKGASGRTYRYYLPTRDIKEGHGASGIKMLPAGEVEEAVVAQVWREISKLKVAATVGMTETQVSVAFNRVNLVWDQLLPLEQHRIVTLLVDRVIVAPDELQVKLRPNGVENLALDVVQGPGRSPAKPVIEGAPA